MKDCAFVDTTILVDFLLGTKENRDRARVAISRYDHTATPQYAIKEFSGGALQKFCYFHNKLKQLGSVAAAVDAIRRLIGYQPMRVATALQALAVAGEAVGSQTIRDVTEPDGKPVNFKEFERDQYLIALLRVVHRAWGQRENVTDEVTDRLRCFLDTAPKIESSGTIYIPTNDCDASKSCSMYVAMKQAESVVRKLMAVAKEMGAGREASSRSRALRKIGRPGPRAFDKEDCRDLGDSVFAFLCPEEWEVLTTNIRHHQPLTEAIGKSAVAPP